jgi:hypothetical protein
MNLEEMRVDSAIHQKKGLHFILASVLIWLAVSIIHSTKLPIETKNLYTFCATAPLMPIAFAISKIIKVDFTHKSNPLTNLGLLFSLNQMLYLLIAMWVYATKPESMVMVLAMIFGAHLLPYSWLYKSVSYKVMAILITLMALIVGLFFDPKTLAAFMVLIEIIFSGLLVVEVNLLNKKIKVG